MLVVALFKYILCIGVAHKKLLSQVEEAMEIQLDDAQRKIRVTQEASICYK